MQRYRALLVAAVLAYCTCASDGSRILGLFQFHGHSHFIMFQALMKGLAAKGHDVTVVSHFPQKSSLPNYTDLSLKGSLPTVVNNFTVEHVRNFKYINLFGFIWNINVEFCSVVLEQPVLQKLIHSNEKFDLIITEIFGVDCCLGFAHKFNTPVISMVSSVAVPWTNYRIGNPDNPSYIPNYFLPYGDKMDFQARVVNTIFYAVTNIGQYIFAELPTNRLLRKHFGEDLPPLAELKKRTSLIFVNSHFSVNVPRPTVPAFVEVGGLHIASPQQLPEDLNNFILESPKGVVYFSFGSLVKTETLSKEHIRAFIDTFRELPQRVLWKCDGDAIPDLPSNVKTMKWMPQLDILMHPNVHAFITHGGLMSTQEAIHAGVPLLGIPLFSDQVQNLNNMAQRGVAVVVNYDTISKDTIQAALRSILENPSYQDNAKRLSKLFRDRPQSAMETAVFWTEYVIRHGGAAHLGSAATDMPLYQYLLLDVIAVLLVAPTLILVAFWFASKKLMSFVRPNQSNKTKKVKSN